MADLTRKPAPTILPFEGATDGELAELAELPIDKVVNLHGSLVVAVARELQKRRSGGDFAVFVPKTPTREETA